MVGRETREDFDVIAVSDPYKVHATQVKTDAPEKAYDAPGKDAPARSDKVSTLRAEDTAIHTQNIRNADPKGKGRLYGLFRLRAQDERAGLRRDRNQQG